MFLKLAFDRCISVSNTNENFQNERNKPEFDNTFNSWTVEKNT